MASNLGTRQVPIVKRVQVKLVDYISLRAMSLVRFLLYVVEKTVRLFYFYIIFLFIYFLSFYVFMV